MFQADPGRFRRAPRAVRGFLAACLISCQTVGAVAAQPNILLLVAEDLSPRIGSYGDSVARTPNLDALAERGVRYTRVFTTAGVCAPSRAALIMGQHQISFAAQHMRTSTGPLGEYYARPDSGLKAFPELLRRAGYYTFTDSKLDYQFSGIRAGSGPFSIWDAQGVDTHWRNREPGQPFFGMINFLETHESGVMRPDGIPHSASHAGTMVFRRTSNLVAAPVTNPADVGIPEYYPDVPEVRADVARHYDNIHAMDARVGKILAELEADGLAGNTIVIWTSDHGDGLPRAKRELLDAGLRVPMLVVLPSQYRPREWRVGGTDSRLVSFVDLAPTLLALAGLPGQDRHHGVNFLSSQREYVYASRDRIDEVADRQRAVRDGRYKYIRSWYPEVPGGHELAYRDNLDMVRAMRSLFQAGKLNAAQSRWFLPVGKEQLYDLETDPDELENLASDPDAAKVKARLKQALASWLARVGDTGEIPEVELRAQLLSDGEIRVTPPPEVRLRDSMLFVRASDGASVGYRVPDGKWRLYLEPVPVTGAIEVKAVRYGWRESQVVSISP